MAQAQLLRRTTFVVLGGSAAFTALPRRTAFAEAPSKDEIPDKKPIYTTHNPSYDIKPTPSPTSPVSTPVHEHPTPTDRLQGQVKRVRLFLYDQSTSVEKTFNNFLTWAFQKETNFANTIASLAPSPETGEQVLPGAIYVLVATMAGSIVARNRNIVVRATFPVAVGVTAGWMLIPVTMRNTSDLIWEYEKKVPAVADAHLATRGAVIEGWRQTRMRTEALRNWSDQKAKEGRDAIEKMVEKGK